MIIKTSGRGFTLIEMLVVIAIIGLLSTMMLVSHSSALKKGRDQKRRADLESLRLAVNLYGDKHSHYPQPAASPLSCGSNSIVINGDSTCSGFREALVDYIADFTQMKDPLADQLSGPQYRYRWLVTGRCQLQFQSELDGGCRTIDCESGKETSGC